MDGRALPRRVLGGHEGPQIGRLLEEGAHLLPVGLEILQGARIEADPALRGVLARGQNGQALQQREDGLVPPGIHFVQGSDVFGELTAGSDQVGAQFQDVGFVGFAGAQPHARAQAVGDALQIGEVQEEVAQAEAPHFVDERPGGRRPAGHVEHALAGGRGVRDDAGQRLHGLRSRGRVDDDGSPRRDGLDGRELGGVAVARAPFRLGRAVAPLGSRQRRGDRAPGLRVPRDRGHDVGLLDVGLDRLQIGQKHLPRVDEAAQKGGVGEGEARQVEPPELTQPGQSLAFASDVRSQGTQIGDLLGVDAVRPQRPQHGGVHFASRGQGDVGVVGSGELQARRTQERGFAHGSGRLA